MISSIAATHDSEIAQYNAGCTGSGACANTATSPEAAAAVASDAVAFRHGRLRVPPGAPVLLSYDAGEVKMLRSDVARSRPTSEWCA